MIWSRSKFGIPCLGFLAGETEETGYSRSAILNDYHKDKTPAS